jgi:hypothetical protein
MLSLARDTSIIIHYVVYLNFMIPDIFVLMKITVHKDLSSQGLFISDSASKID